MAYAELVKQELKCGHGWTHVMMSLEENPIVYG